MNHEALFQTSDALHQHDSDHNENDDEHVSARRHFVVHFVQHRLDVGGGNVWLNNVRHTRGNGVVGRG